jgi:hypothetical protein
VNEFTFSSNRKYAIAIPAGRMPRGQMAAMSPARRAKRELLVTRRPSAASQNRVADDNGRMDAKDDRSALLSAMTTEHVVMQSAISAALSEAQSRANIFIGALSGALVAMGFATQSETIFLPFVATVLPAIFVMGVFTVLRLVDVSVESARAEICIATIRRFYRSLGGDAETLFSPELGRGPEGKANPATRLGFFVGYWTTAAAMIAVIDAMVAAAGVVLLLHLGTGLNLIVAILIGAAAALGLLVAFHYLQKMRIAESEAYARDVASIRPEY